MRLTLHVHYRLFSVTSEESLRHSEPPLTDTPAPRDRRLHEVLVCETCACVIHTILYTLSALVLSSYINVCAGYMCFVKL